jgi:DNA-binding NtrC family response regulator
MAHASVSAKECPSSKLSALLDQISEPVPPLNVVIVSADVAVCVAMNDLLQKCFVRVIPANGLKELKALCSRITPNVCLCGFDLADGSLREVVDFLEQRPRPTPVIMVSAPVVGDPPSHFLDSVRAGALATICYPYRLREVQLMVWTVIQCQREFGRLHGQIYDSGSGPDAIAAVNR